MIKLGDFIEIDFLEAGDHGRNIMVPSTSSITSC